MGNPKEVDANSSEIDSEPDADPGTDTDADADADADADTDSDTDTDTDADTDGTSGSTKPTVGCDSQGYETIQQAIDAEERTITICAGTYSESLTFSGVSMTLEAEGSVIIRGDMDRPVTLDESEVTLEGIDLVGSYGVEYGGVGLVDSNSALTLSNCDASDGIADYGGGFAIDGWSSVTVDNSVIHGNYAWEQGGAFFITGGGEVFDESDDSSEISYNASHGQGGMAYIDGDGEWTGSSETGALYKYESNQTDDGTSGAFHIAASDEDNSVIVSFGAYVLFDHYTTGYSFLYLEGAKGSCYVCTGPVPSGYEDSISMDIPFVYIEETDKSYSVDYYLDGPMCCDCGGVC